MAEDRDKDLRTGGVQFKVMYIGFTAINHPVHDMTNDMREMLFEFTVDTLKALKNKENRPMCNSVLNLVIEQPRLINKNVMIAVSSKNISVTHDDESDPMRMGGLIMRFPMKYVSVIKWMAPDHFAFIAKRLDGSNRRCCVFNAMKTETICSEDVIKEAMEKEKAQNEGSSESTTPTVSQNSSSASLVAEHREETRPRRSAPLPIDKIIPGPKAAELAQYRWYHGIFSREKAAEILRHPGEFLIRESENQKNQVILSGMSDSGEHKHLLLIDSEGKVKTEDRGEFGSVAELVQFYLSSQSTIMMANDPQIRLMTPVDRPH